MPPGPAAASKAAASQAEEEEAIAARLLTGVSNVAARGRPPLFKALAKSFLAFTDAAQNGSADDAAAAHAAFVAEVDALELQLHRLAATAEANARETAGFSAKRAALEAQIAAAGDEIRLKKEELAAARVARQHKEEYEALRAMIAAQPPRAATEAQIAAERAAAAALRAEQARHAAALERKRRAFALLMRCVEDLQRQGGDDDGDGGGAGAGGGGTAPMSVD